ncbi:DUF6114 domain-containing protein [Paractinoplanes rishiriensis]|uniref:Uncharacterized protein n=1 Tax=Paractinoplanes rishiriensis TaxID=1050105 RepID=A0A919K421_9ACTN|nr:DUF6114 domain-containing protein [Actinoplanes rishiriensis]GIE98912.1 hypothetical protein Ari01nite_63770 [Actinoplanes rishiriensis]
MKQRSAFWHWRHARPFWGGLFVTLGGAEMFLTVMAPLPVVVHVGMDGLASFLVPVLILICGLLLLFNPQQRLFYSLVAAVLALGSWITSNLGGFVIGLLLSIVGSALAFAWSPTAKKAPAAKVPAATDGPAEEERPAAIWRPAEEMPTEIQPADTGAPGVHPETSHSRPRHSRTSPGSLSGE